MYPKGGGSHLLSCLLFSLNKCVIYKENKREIQKCFTFNRDRSPPSFRLLQHFNSTLEFIPCLPCVVCHQTNSNRTPSVLLFNTIFNLSNGAHLMVNLLTYFLLSPGLELTPNDTAPKL